MNKRNEFVSEVSGPHAAAAGITHNKNNLIYSFNWIDCWPLWLGPQSINERRKVHEEEKKRNKEIKERRAIPCAASSNKTSNWFACFLCAAFALPRCGAAWGAVPFIPAKAGNIHNSFSNSFHSLLSWIAHLLCLSFISLTFFPFLLCWLINLLSCSVLSLWRSHGRCPPL